jgi:DNA topoisomerase-1
LLSLHRVPPIVTPGPEAENLGRGYLIAAMPRLRRSDCSGPGLRRVRRGRGFSYLDPEGERVTDPETLARIEGLVIPPAWRDVWICAHANGHIQATGYDEAGRKQYLYHEHWRAHRDREKFETMLELAGEFPRVRRRIKRDLGRRGLVRERVLACALRLLDLGFFRVGGEQYAEENETYGLATIRRRHVSFERGLIVFDYRSKNAQRRIQTIDDPEIVPTVRALRRRRGGGHELLAYRNGDRWHDVRSEEINAYVKEVAGGEFTAKDFRTWNATVLAAVAVAMRADAASSPTARKRIAREAAKAVAAYLGNTSAISRSSYIDPRVFDRFDSGETVRSRLDELGGRFDPARPTHRHRVETAVLELIR